ncbi:hypothetical protein [Endozoicomonas arenosclerae]|uniref:hypothetical protein n=1 Tax=Endozoicomonas arenosclerae TaxID=1633495 RepID=UPI000780E75E|nr:hypothetical protein [Endozoicomonas arenosclerae]
MRFSEALNLGPNRTLLSINDSEYEQLIDRWTREMGASKLFGYRKSTRVEHWQEAVDTAYTCLEKELQSSDPKKIMSHPKWTLLIGCGKRNFPEHIAIFQPSPTEQTRVKRMVRNTLVTRVVSNKIDLLDIIKKDKDGSVVTIGDLAVSRLRYELLAASADRAVDSYMKESDTDWSTWFEWQESKADWYEAGANSEAETSRKLTGFKDGIRKASAEASASYSGSAAAGLKLDKEYEKGGLKQTLKGNLEASASLNANANAAARMSELAASAEAGLESDAHLRADIDYELTYSCKVKGEHLRRILGPKFDLIKVHAAGQATADATASGTAKASARLFSDKSEVGAEKDLQDSSAKAEVSKGEALIRGVKVDLEGEATLAVKMSGNASINVGQAAEIELSGDLFAGAKGSGNMNFFINGRGVGMDLGAEFFAGFEVSSEQTLRLIHPSRRVNIFSMTAKESFQAGFGAAAKLAAKATVDEVSFDTKASAAMAIGSSISASGIVSPRGIALVGYDALAVPAIHALSYEMQKHYPSTYLTQRFVSFSPYLNRQASKSELNQVYMDCRTRMVSLLATLDNEADSVQKRAARTPGFNGYGDVMSVDEINKVEGFAGNSHSKYFEYATEEIKLSSGQVLQSVTKQGDRLEQVVSDDKAALLKAAKEYAGQKKIMKSGECIAFEVIKKDYKSGQINY